MKKILTLLILSFCAILNAQNIYVVEISSALCPLEDFSKVEKLSQDGLASYLKADKSKSSTLTINAQANQSVSFKIGQEMRVPETRKLIGEPIAVQGSVFIFENAEFIDCYLDFKKSLTKGIVNLKEDLFAISDALKLTKLIPKLKSGEIRIISAKITDDSIFAEQKYIEFCTIKITRQGASGSFNEKVLKRKDNGDYEWEDR